MHRTDVRSNSILIFPILFIWMLRIKMVDNSKQICYLLEWATEAETYLILKFNTFHVECVCACVCVSVFKKCSEKISLNCIFASTKCNLRETNEEIFINILRMLNIANINIVSRWHTHHDDAKWAKYRKLIFLIWLLYIKLFAEYSGWLAGWMVCACSCSCSCTVHEYRSCYLKSTKAVENKPFTLNR